MGNRLTKTEGSTTTAYVYDLCNKLLSETESGITTEYIYDALGNLTEKTDSTGTTTYAYDALNQLTEVVKPDGTWQTNTYDASGIRSMIAENGVTTEFMTFNGLVLGGYDKSGEQTEHYYYGAGLIAAELAAGSTGADNSAETSLYYYLKNSHGDVIGLTDNDGTLTETYRYDAFGTLTSIQSLNEKGVLAEAETALSRFLYAGEQYDDVTGLYYLRARQYDTIIGRFTQEDTYLGDGRNLYAYVRNNPLKYVDPSGYDSIDVAEKVNGYYIEMRDSADPSLSVEKEIGEVRIGEGAAKVVQGLFAGFTGAFATVVAVINPPSAGLYVAAVGGSGLAFIGANNVYEGGQDIYYGANNSDEESVNPLRNFLFGGNQEAYNILESIMAGITAAGAVGAGGQMPPTPNPGNINDYANAVSQGVEFVESAGELLEAGEKAISYAEYYSIYQNSIHNPNADMVMLGKYDNGGPTSYINQAGTEYTYFSLDDWSMIKEKYGFTDDDMFTMFNEAFLDDGINAGKIFKFSHNPVGDQGALGKEFAYLFKNGYIWDEITMTMSPGN